MGNYLNAQYTGLNYATSHNGYYPAIGNNVVREHFITKLFVIYITFKKKTR